MVDQQQLPFVIYLLGGVSKSTYTLLWDAENVLEYQKQLSAHANMLEQDSQLKYLCTEFMTESNDKSIS